MIVIRRMVDRQRAYTGIFLKGEPPRIFPTSDQEHARILSIFMQDRAHPDVENDFSVYAIGEKLLPPEIAARVARFSHELPPPGSVNSESNAWGGNAHPAPGANPALWLTIGKKIEISGAV